VGDPQRRGRGGLSGLVALVLAVGWATLEFAESTEVFAFVTAHAVVRLTTDWGIPVGLVLTGFVLPGGPSEAELHQ